MSNDKQFSTGAIRSSDADSLDFLSLPLLGLIGVARTSHEGGTKYGRFNYMLGMPAHECVNHAVFHIVRWAAGDRSEPHLSHAAWNLMAADQSMVLDPDLNDPHLPGPGYVITEDIREYLASGKPDRDRRRQDGEFTDAGKWSLDRLPEVQAILGITPDEVLYAVERVGAVDVKPGEFMPDDQQGEFANYVERFMESDDFQVNDPRTPVCVDCFDRLGCVPSPNCVAEPPKKVIYLSGPMSGIPEYNFPAFNAAAEQLRELGYRVINPADFGCDDGKTWAECLARDLAYLPEADLVLTLPGWGDSRGARLEVHVARELGIKVEPFSVYVRSIA